MRAHPRQPARQRRPGARLRSARSCAPATPGCCSSRSPTRSPRATRCSARRPASRSGSRRTSPTWSTNSRCTGPRPWRPSRGSSRRCTTLPATPLITTARARSSTGPPTSRSDGRVSMPPGGVRPWTAVEHFLFDRLVYGKIRHAFGGRLRLCFSGGGPLGERLTHFFAGVGVQIYEGYGLTETSPTLTLNRPGAWKPGTVGRPLAGPRSGSPTTARSSPRAHRCSRGTGTTRLRPPRCSTATAGSARATSANSTTRATCGSPAARRS